MRHALVAVASLATLVPVACSGLTSQSLIPDPVAALHQRPGTVRVEARGRSPVTSRVLGEALAETVAAGAHFGGGVVDGEADWLLSATVVDVLDPEWSLVMTARVTIDYRLAPSGAQAVAWGERIETSFKADPDDAEGVEERGRFAVSAAVRDNLAQAMASLSEADPR